MSTRQKPPSDAQLVQAAELRIGNHTWEAVGKKLNRAAETVRRWPTLYAERWRTALHHAERRFAVDCQSEAVVALRFLLRDKDSKIVWHAAKALVGLRLELGKLDVRTLAHTNRGESLDKAKLAVEILEGLSDDDFTQLVSSEHERAARMPATDAGSVPAGAA